MMNITDIELDNKIEESVQLDSEHKTSRGRQYLLFAVALLCAIVFYFSFSQSIANWSNGDANVQLKQLQISTVERGRLVKDISVNGTIIARAKPTLTSHVGGTVTLKAAVGDIVSQGQVVATIDNPQIRNKLKQEQSTLEQMTLAFQQFELQTKLDLLDVKRALDEAQAALLSAKREMRRTEQSMQGNLISGIDYETAVDNLAGAQRAHTHAKEYDLVFKDKKKTDRLVTLKNIETQQLKVASLKLDIARLEIRSPIDGQIGRIEVADYQSIASDMPIMTIIDLTSYVVDIDIPQNYANQVKVAMSVEISIGDDIIKGQLSSISPEIVDGVSKAVVQLSDLSVANVRQNLKVYARLLLMNKDNVLKLKKGDFLESNNQGALYVVNHAHDLATRRKVTFGLQSISHIEIIAGLKVNEEVIISSVDGFKGSETILITN